MNSRSTWYLVLMALGLGTFVFFDLQRTRKPATPKAVEVFARLAPDQVTQIELLGATETVRVERSQGKWRMVAPVAYPANGLAIERFLAACQKLERQAVVSVQELAAQPRGLADYGLQPPQASIKFHEPKHTLEVRIGSFTPVGSQLYLQIGDAPEVEVVGAEFAQAFPRGVADWRDTALMNLAGLNFDRMEVRTGNRGFEVQRNATNSLWWMTKPAPIKRADTPKINTLIEQMRNWQVQRFETDDVTADLTRYGLQPPELELAFGRGTNELLVVQFGRPATNNPALIYARRLSHTNIVQVPASWAEVLRLPFVEFRDKRLASFPPAAVDQVDIHGPENFTLRRETNNFWRINGTNGAPADPVLLQIFLENLSRIEAVEFVRDVGTDFTEFGLATPSRQITLSTTVTNAGALTNQALVQVDFGLRRGLDKIHARRQGEDSVYAVPLGDLERLPEFAFQIRDRRVWNFDGKNLTAVSVEQNGKSHRIMRNAEGKWVLAPGVQGVIKAEDFGLEEYLDRLCKLQVENWVAQGDDRLAPFGINDASLKISLEFGDKAPRQELHFGRQASSLRPYAATKLDGRTVIFEFPLETYLNLSTALPLPPLRGQ